MTSPAPTDVHEPTRDIVDLRGKLKEALRELKKRRPRVDLSWDYYNGDHPQLWMSPRMARIFGAREEGVLQDNYCELAIDAPLERLQVTGWTSDSPEDTEQAAGETKQLSDADRMNVLWRENRLHLEQEDLWRSSQIAGRGYVIVWPRFDDTGQQLVDEETGIPLFDLAVNDARDVYLKFGFHHGIRLWGCKVLYDEDERVWTAVFYFDDEVIRLRTKTPTSAADESEDGKKGRPDWPKPEAFDFDDEDPGDSHDLGFCPVYEFAQSPQGKSRLRTLAPVQNKINKLEANKMVTAEFLAWGQRYAINAGDLDDDELRPTPGSLLLIEPPAIDEDEPEGSRQPTSVGTFPAADLSNIDSAVEKEVRTFFTLARLPKHMMVNPGADPSGDAISGDEGPMVAMVEDHQQMYGGTLDDIAHDLGYAATPQWKPAEISDDKARAETVKTFTDAGVPIRTALRKATDWDEDDLDEVDQGVEAAAARATTAGAVAMQAFSQGRSAAQLAAEDSSAA